MVLYSQNIYISGISIVVDGDDSNDRAVLSTTTMMTDDA